MSIFESFGEMLGRAVEALPAVTVEHISDVEEAPDILGHSVDNQWGVQSEAIGSAVLELANDTVITPEDTAPIVQPDSAPVFSEANLDSARNNVDAVFDEIFEKNPDLSQNFQKDFTLN